MDGDDCCIVCDGVSRSAIVAKVPATTLAKDGENDDDDNSEADDCWIARDGVRCSAAEKPAQPAVTAAAPPKRGFSQAADCCDV